MTNPNSNPDAGKLGSTTTARFQIEGMHCGSCAKRIEKSVLKLPGVVSVEIDLASKSAEVGYDGARLAPAKIQEQIISAGYQCAVLG